MASSSGLRIYGLGGNRSPLPMQVRVHFEPSLAIVAKHIDALSIELAHFKEPLTEAVEKVMVPSIRRNFETAGHGTWSALSDFAMDMRDRGLVRFDHSATPTGGILVFTGELKRAAASKEIWDITDDSAVVRDLPEKIQYGKTHQSGTYGGHLIAYSEFGQQVRGAKFKKVGGSLYGGVLVSKGRPAPDVPPRPFLIIWPDDEIKIRQVFDNWIQKKLDGFTAATRAARWMPGGGSWISGVWHPGGGRWV